MLANRIGENVSLKKPTLNASKALPDHQNRPLVSKHAPKPVLSNSNKDNKIGISNSHPLSSVWAKKYQTPLVCTDCEDSGDNIENHPPVRAKFGPSASVATTPNVLESVSNAKSHLTPLSSSIDNFPENGFKYIEPRFVYDINCVVFVGNVAPTTTQDMLSSFFSQFGTPLTSKCKDFEMTFKA